MVLAEGAEEMETVIAVDVLRRGGIEVLVAGLDGADPVVCSRGVRLVPDLPLADAASAGPFDAIVLPGGGPGSERLASSSVVGELLRDQVAADRLVAAVCAAPTALAAHGVGADRLMTSHPGAREVVEAFCRGYREEPVVEDGSVITSRGPGTSFAFALAIVARLRGGEVADSIAAPMML